jgi:hypothetical protein
VQPPWSTAIAVRSRTVTMTRFALTDNELTESCLQPMKLNASIEATRFDCVRESAGEAANVLVQGEQAAYGHPDEMEEARS